MQVRSSRTESTL